MIDRLKEVFEYRDGFLFRKIPMGSRGKVGVPVGTLKNGYLSTKVDGKKLLVHRIIFFIHHEYLPDIVDHINGDPLDNRIENLREATQGLNRVNSKTNKDSKTGYKGVNYRKKQGYRARFRGKHLGWFKTAEDAAKRYDKEVIKIYGKSLKLNFN